MASIFDKAAATASALAGVASERVRATYAKVSRPTPSEKSRNARNNAMVKEMKEFKENVLLLINEFTETSNKLAGTMRSVGHVMSQHLPVAYDSAPSGRGAEPVDTSRRFVGEGVDAAAICRAPMDFQARMKERVLNPLENWLAAYRRTKERNYLCEAVALDVDAQEKIVTAAERTANERQSRGHKDAGAAFEQFNAEKEKEQGLLAQFATMESEIFNEMLKSIDDIKELRRYVLVALQTMQDFLAGCSSSFDLQTPISLKMPARAQPSHAAQEAAARVSAEAHKPAPAQESQRAQQQAAPEQPYPGQQASYEQQQQQQQQQQASQQAYPGQQLYEPQKQQAGQQQYPVHQAYEQQAGQQTYTAQQPYPGQQSYQGQQPYPGGQPYPAQQLHQEQAPPEAMRPY